MMSAQETVAWLIVSGLAGGAIGAVGAAVFLTRPDRRSRRHRAESRLHRVCARWLAAQLSLSRASRSLVAAFRSLAVEPRDSPYLGLRRKEAQRARADWCKAAFARDRSQAELIVWSVAFPHKGGNIPPPHVGADALRVAIDGDAGDLEELTRLLQSEDQRAVAFIKSLEDHSRPHPRQRLPVIWGQRIVAAAGRIVDGWASPPHRK